MREPSASLSWREVIGLDSSTPSHSPCGAVGGGLALWLAPAELEGPAASPSGQQIIIIFLPSENSRPSVFWSHTVTMTFSVQSRRVKFIFCDLQSEYSASVRVCIFTQSHSNEYFKEARKMTQLYFCVWAPPKWYCKSRIAKIYWRLGTLRSSMECLQGVLKYASSVQCLWQSDFLMMLHSALEYCLNLALNLQMTARVTSSNQQVDEKSLWCANIGKDSYLQEFYPAHWKAWQPSWGLHTLFEHVSVPPGYSLDMQHLLGVVFHQDIGLC